MRLKSSSQEDMFSGIQIHGRRELRRNRGRAAWPRTEAITIQPM